MLTCISHYLHKNVKVIRFNVLSVWVDLQKNNKRYTVYLRSSKGMKQRKLKLIFKF